MTSIFTKIIQGEIPSYKIYEDTHTYAFLDINPINKGHILVVPKHEVQGAQDLSVEECTALFLTVQKMSQLLERKLHPKRVGILVDGYEVPHAHVHVVPTYGPGELVASRAVPATSDELLTMQATLLS